MQPKQKAPVGVLFMEEMPDNRTGGHYDHQRHQWVDEEGQPSLLSAATVTGSNASTGGREETDTNEDFDD